MNTVSNWYQTYSPYFKFISTEKKKEISDDNYNVYQGGQIFSPVDFFLRIKMSSSSLMTSLKLYFLHNLLFQRHGSFFEIMLKIYHIIKGHQVDM